METTNNSVLIRFINFLLEAKNCRPVKRPVASVNKAVAMVVVIGRSSGVDT
jgi:hypothetical protein